VTRSAAFQMSRPAAIETTAGGNDDQRRER
jgi:hypothetical protein